MRFMATLVAIVTALSSGTGAQTFMSSPNPVSDSVRTLLARDSKNLVASAELMPPEKYGYRPTPAQMTFGDLIVHIVQTNVALCSAISGAKPMLSPEEMRKLSGTDAKENLVQSIKQSFDYCTENLSKMTDSQLGEEGTMFGRPSGQSRAMMMVTIAADWADHYGTAASYLRLNGILPPTAQPKR
jgi:uncharacterized damage-inducible protein DinB